MKTYVIFDRKTGKILQTHVQSEQENGDLDVLLRTVRPEATAEAVDLLEVEGIKPGNSYRVDLKARKLALVKGTKDKSSGGGALLLPAGGPLLRSG